ncbi:SBBP repeat-containing protein [Myxococcus fulvus]|uniref:SBBP repeat-containing protein n=1 Tax=Myxococcus fulvus TaxID=33 RepID=UPI0020BFB5CE|nr:SBBP repeat-containing protein [Myxococcus fulvus]
MARNRSFEERYVAGWTSGALDGNPSIPGSSAFLMRYRYTGVHGWTRQIGVANAQTEGYGVAVDAHDNAFLVGLTQPSGRNTKRVCQAPPAPPEETSPAANTTAGES